MSAATNDVLSCQVERLTDIHNALTLLMRELYERSDSTGDPAPTHADCYAWAEGAGWLVHSIARVRDGVAGARNYE